MKYSSDFEVLGVSNTASIKEIRQRYKQLCLELHPDKGGDVNRFIEMHASYKRLEKILSDSSSSDTDPQDDIDWIHSILKCFMKIPPITIPINISIEDIIKKNVKEIQVRVKKADDTWGSETLHIDTSECADTEATWVFEKRGDEIISGLRGDIHIVASIDLRTWWKNDSIWHIRCDITLLDWLKGCKYIVDISDTWKLQITWPAQRAVPVNEQQLFYKTEWFMIIWNILPHWNDSTFLKSLR
jgi:DnaJ domain